MKIFAMFTKNSGPPNSTDYMKMAKDDIVLRVEMGKLEIQPVKAIQIKEENPFVPVFQSTQKKSRFTRMCHHNIKICTCEDDKSKKLPICKKKTKKILKDPVLKLLQVKRDTSGVKEECQSVCSKKIPSPVEGSDILGLCALVDNCNQLKISSGANEPIAVNAELNIKNKWWKTKLSSLRQSRESTCRTSQTGSCSQQALNPPCDVTIDELASYFETLVHIPKKMSSMAEMMYI